MAKSDDLVLRALVAFERHTRARKYGGLLDMWRLAKDALAEYKSRASAEANAVIEDGKRATLEFARTGDGGAGRRMTRGMRAESRRVYEAMLERGGIDERT